MATNYDFIIVGAGTTGGALAALMSYGQVGFGVGGKGPKILIVEQGYNNNVKDIVKYARNLFKAESNPTVTDAYTTVAENNLDGRQLTLKAGRGWGGSSAMSDMVAIRPSQSFINGMNSLTGYLWDNTVTNDQMKCMETYSPITPPADTSRGVQGPTNILQLPAGVTTVNLQPAGISDAINDQVAASGLAFQIGSVLGATQLIPNLDDYNATTAPENSVVVREQAFVKYSNAPVNGVAPTLDQQYIRQSSGISYIRPVADENGISPCNVYNNLWYTQGVKVVKVEFENVCGKRKATGLKVVLGDKCCTYTANCAIILSAGVIETPSLLMRSGYGPKNVLDTIGICAKDAVYNNNVGRHLLTHIGPDIVLDRDITTTYGIAPSILAFVENNGFVHSFLPSPPYPDAYVQDRKFLVEVRQDQPSATATDRVRIIARDLLPSSEGVVEITTQDAFTDPIIRTNAYLKTQDRQAARQFMRNIYNAIQNANTAFGTLALLWPYSNPNFLTDEQLDYLISQLAEADLGCGTCRMGAENTSAVVDSNFKIFDFDNLYVCDMSVFPILPDSTMQIPALLLAYKFADILRKLFPALQGPCVTIPYCKPQPFYYAGYNLTQ